MSQTAFLEYERHIILRHVRVGIGSIYVSIFLPFHSVLSFALRHQYIVTPTFRRHKHAIETRFDLGRTPGFTAEAMPQWASIDAAEDL